MNGPGHDAVTPATVALSAPDLDEADAERVRRCVLDGWVSTAGPQIAVFEERFAAAVGASHAVAVASGTAALHLALAAAGVGPGDEVWVSDLTFVASANAARYCGAEVGLVDAEAATWNLDPELVAGELRARARRGHALPRAVVAVHVLGHPARLAPLVEACRAHDVIVVEDAAEGLGGGWMHRPDDADAPVGTFRPVGTVGLAGCFSFNGNKMITTGGGGMVVTDDAALAGRVRHLATQAKLPGMAYDHDAVGFNYRMPALNAALGIGQLERLARTVAARRAVADRYDAAFRGRPGLTVQPDEPWARRCGWLSAVLLDDRTVRDAVLTGLRAAGIEARPLWTPLHRMTPYRAATRIGSGTVADRLADRGLCLPSSASLAPWDQDRVIAIVRSVAEASAAPAGSGRGALAA